MRSLYLLGMMLLLLMPVPAQAVRLFTCGFEENAILTTMWATAAGTAPTIGSTAPHSGTYRLNTAAASGNSSVKTSITAHTSGTLYTRFYIRADDATPSANTTVFSNTSSAPALAVQITWLMAGNLRLTNVITSTAATDGVTTLADNTWYRIEVEHVLSDTVGTMTVRLYDDALNLLETIGPISGEDTLPVSITGFNFGKTASTTTFSYDDPAINDATGSVHTSWPGPGKIYMLVPDSNVSIKYEDSAGGTNNATFANIDDLPGTPNDADYNADDTTLDAADATGDIDQFGLTNLGAEVPSDAVINVVDAYARAGSSQTAATHLRLKLWDDVSTLTSGGSHSVNVNGWNVTAGVDASRATIDGIGKTKSKLDSFNVGYESFTETVTGRPRRVSALWVNVEWTEAVAAASGLQYPTFFGGIVR